MMTHHEPTLPIVATPAPRQVVVVSKHPHLSGVLETVLDSAQYDVVFVESTQHAYSHIKRMAPHLVIVCLDIDDLDGFQVLSMLKLDSETRTIPVVTCTLSVEDAAPADEPGESEDEVFAEPAPMCMN